MIYLFIMGGIFAADCFLKWWIEKKPDDYGQEIWGGRILLQKSHNRGAMLNFMEGKRQFVTGISVGITIGTAVVFAALLRRKGEYVYKAALAFVLGGALSNVFDRIKRHYVVDYFSFCAKYERLRRIVFNLGDIFIFLGAFLVFYRRILKNL